MVAPYVQRKTLHWPSRPSQGATNAFGAYGVPGPADIGGFHPDDLFQKESSANYASVEAQYAFPREAAGVYQRIDFPQTQGLGPLRAIGIAADSIIHACDIAIMGRDGELDRHRVSPGNPLIGELDNAQYAMVSIPNGVPHFIVTDADIFFHAVQFAAGTSEAPNNREVAWPLRLELWRSDPLLPLRQHLRAPLFAHGIHRFASGADNRVSMICVDGRRRIDLTVMTEGCGATVAVAQAHSMVNVPLSNLSFYPVFEAMTINGAATEAVLDGVPETFSFEGNSLQFLRVTLDPDAAGYAQVKIVARDDY